MRGKTVTGKTRRFVPLSRNNVGIGTVLMTDFRVKDIMRECRAMGIPIIYHEFSIRHSTFGSRHPDWRVRSNGVSSHELSVRERDFDLFILRFGQSVRHAWRHGQLVSHGRQYNSRDVYDRTPTTEVWR